MTKQQYWVGFDLGGTKMLVSIFDANFKILASTKKKTKGNLGAESGLKRMVDAIDAALKKAGLSRAHVSGIGVGCPGPLNIDKGIILEAPNLGWSNVPVKKTLKQAFKCPVVIANDVDAGTYGEYQFGAAKGARCVLGVFPGTGVGGACIYEGKIFRGKVGSCMEIGHFPVDPRGVVAGPGRTGSLESMTSRLAIAAQAAQAVYRGQAPALKKLAGTDLAEIRSGILASAIAQGDTIIEEIVRHSARLLGTTVSGVINLLAPDVLVLGGGLVEALGPIYIDEVTRVVKAEALPSYAAAVKISSAKLGDDAGCMGAAALASTAKS